MIAVGRYLVFLISLAEMTLCVDDAFSEENIAQFLNYILQLHNDVRDKHGVQSLKRTDELDVIASEKIDKLFSGVFDNFDLYGLNYRMECYNNDTKLDAEEAEEFFSKWYNTDDEYNYFFEPLHNRDDDFTQIVWKDTKSIGIALRRQDPIYLVLVTYDPPGNIKGQFTSNVMIPPSIAAERNPENNMLIYQGDENRFLVYIWELHNAARSKHGIGPLQRVEYMDSKASKLCRMYYGPKYSGNYKIKTIMRYFHEDFKMDAAEAKAIFSEWFDKGKNDDVSVAPSNENAAAFTHIMFEDTVFFGIAMKRFTSAYRVVGLYSPPEYARKKHKKNVTQLQHMEQGESSVNN